MYWSRPAEGEERQPPWIAPPLQRVHPCRAGHPLVDDLVDPPGRLVDGDAERLGDDAADRLPRPRDVERHRPAEEEAGVEVAQDDVGVGDRRLRPAQAVADRPRIGARRVGPDLEQSQRVDAGDGAAAGADLDHFDHGEVDRQARALLEAVAAIDLEAVRQERLSPVDDRELGGRPPHIKGKERVVAGRRPERRRRQRPAGRAALQQAHREAGRRLDRGQRAGGDHHEERAAKAGPRQPLLQIAQVALDPCLDEDVGDGRRGPFVLADFRHHVGRDGDAHPRRGALDRFPRPSFQLRIGEAVEEGDGNRLDPGRGELPRQPLDVRLVEVVPFERRAVGQRPPRHTEAEVARRQRRRHLQLQVVEVVAVLAPDLQRVAEAFCRQECRLRSLPLDEGVGDQRRAVDDLPDCLHRLLRLGQRLGQTRLDRPRWIVRRGERLADDELSRGVVINHQIGERAADVDAGAESGVVSRESWVVSGLGPRFVGPFRSSLTRLVGKRRHYRSSCRSGARCHRASYSQLTTHDSRLTTGYFDSGKISAAGERIAARMPPSTAIICPVT